MKVFIGGSKSVSALDESVIEHINGYIKNGVEILIGDCFGTDTLIQKELIGYEKVTVYSPFEKARNNVDNWEVKQSGKKIHSKTYNNGYNFYAAKDSAMAMEADCGFMVWNGRSKGTFINMINLVLLKKPVKVYICEKQEIADVKNIDELESILIKNPNYVGLHSVLPKNLYEPCIKACGFSKEMEEYLLDNPVSKYKVLSTVLGAPISLEKKKEILKSLAITDDLLQDIVFHAKINDAERDTEKLVELSFTAHSYIDNIFADSFVYNYTETAKALKELKLKSGEIFTLEECYYDTDILMETNELNEPFTSYEVVLSYIKREMEYYKEDMDEDEDLYGWYELSKWVPDKNGTMRCTYRYTLQEDTPIYFERNPWRSNDENVKTYPEVYNEKPVAKKDESISLEDVSGAFCDCKDDDGILSKSFEEYKRYADSFYEYNGCLRYHDLNLPIPFKPGDIVTVDCVPFAEKKQIVLIEVENFDCCGVQALYRHYDGLWRTGALKHNDCWDTYHHLLSTLYRLSEFTGELKEEEKLMNEVREYVKKDEKNGRILWDAIYKGEIPEKKRGGVTEESIREFLKKTKGEN